MCNVIGWFTDINGSYHLVTESGGMLWSQCAVTGNTMPIHGTPAEYGLKPDAGNYPFIINKRG